MATLRKGQYAHSYRACNDLVQKKIVDYLDSLPDGYIICSAELKELIFGEIQRMRSFELMCKELILMCGFEYIKRPITNEYGQQRCYIKRKTK